MWFSDPPRLHSSCAIIRSLLLWHKIAIAHRHQWFQIVYGRLLIEGFFHCFDYWYNLLHGQKFNSFRSLHFRSWSQANNHIESRRESSRDKTQDGRLRTHSELETFSNGSSVITTTSATTVATTVATSIVRAL